MFLFSLTCPPPLSNLSSSSLSPILLQMTNQRLQKTQQGGLCTSLKLRRLLFILEPSVSLDTYKSIHLQEIVIIFTSF